jgi:hypothetical protein
MKFDKLVNNILKPINEKVRPSFSGKVERYITFVRSLTYFPHGPWSVEGVRDDEFNMFQHEYVKEMCYEGTDFHNAFGAYVHALQGNGVYRALIEDAKHEAWHSLRHLNGIAIFKICVLPHIIYMKIEIDTARAKAIEIQKDLKDVDTSGFDDLL